LEKIVADQRQIISRVMNTNAESVPQVWALYKEVQGYYEKGMRVPDDVTLLWCDDNWGNLRRLPTAAERQRSGGAGIYYHFDYVGGPRNYKWLNTVPITKVQEQMNLAYHYGADRLWIVNVGDLKPMEFPIEFFLTFARQPDQWPADRLGEYTRLWAEREFGPEHAGAIAEIVSRYTKFNGRRKPELLEPGTFSLENYDEADRVIADWKAIVEKAETIYGELPKESRDAFYQLVLYPTKASTVVNELYVAVARNRFYAAKNDDRANRYAIRARELFQEDAELSDYYNHQLAGGKWNHMMDQTHIGYTGWQEPRSNVMPRVMEVTNSAAGNSASDSQVQPVNRETPSNKPPVGWRGFVESDGYVSIEAEHFTRKIDTKSIRWQILPDHGRTLSGVTTSPVTSPSVTPTKGSAHLEYQMWLSRTGAVEVALILSPALNFMPDRGVRIAISFDDEAPQMLTVVPKGYSAGDGNRDWEKSVKDSVRMVKSPQTISTVGAHTLKIWSVDPAVVLQKILVDCGGLKPSYLGPPESYRD
ncbi:MAG TPA: glycosyl hydrolase 115 family protein, partial [Verrucomicrobiae bacterium]